MPAAIFIICQLTATLLVALVPLALALLVWLFDLAVWLLAVAWWACRGLVLLFIKVIQALLRLINRRRDATMLQPYSSSKGEKE